MSDDERQWRGYCPECGCTVRCTEEGECLECYGVIPLAPEPVEP